MKKSSYDEETEQHSSVPPPPTLTAKFMAFGRSTDEELRFLPVNAWTFSTGDGFIESDVLSFTAVISSMCIKPVTSAERTEYAELSTAASQSEKTGGHFLGKRTDLVLKTAENFNIEQWWDFSSVEESNLHFEKNRLKMCRTLEIYCHFFWRGADTDKVEPALLKVLAARRVVHSQFEESNDADGALLLFPPTPAIDEDAPKRCLRCVRICRVIISRRLAEYSGGSAGKFLDFYYLKRWKMNLHNVEE
uniref:Uncharacterized protein n=1 Tax=Romanomermis culicivorax TaxID=13658 RepID=A0A915L068_ROMCU